MAINPGDFSSSGVTSPAGHAEAITPADTDMTQLCRSVYVGVAGNLAVKMAGDEIVTFIAVAAGSVLPIRCKQIRATNTTAASIIALF